MLRATYKAMHREGLSLRRLRAAAALNFGRTHFVEKIPDQLCQIFWEEILVARRAYRLKTSTYLQIEL